MRRHAGSTSRWIVRAASSSPATARTARSANTASRSAAVACSMRAKKCASVCCSMVNVPALIALFPLLSQWSQCRRGGFHVPCPPAVTRELPDCHGSVTAVRRSCQRVSACGFVLHVGRLHLVLAHETEHVLEEEQVLAGARKAVGRQ